MTKDNRQFSVKIHQGAREVGGNCIEIIDEKNRIILDFGMPFWFEKAKRALRDRSAANLLKNNLLPDIAGLYRPDNGRPIDAILLSHPHKDHYGHLYYSLSQIPIYLSVRNKKLLKIYWQLVAEQEQIEKGRLYGLKENKPFTLPGTNISVDLINVDHSSAGSSAMLINFNGIKIAYTGDLRFHGQRSEESQCFVRQAREFRPDYLIIEGTHIDSDPTQYTGCKTEDEVKDRCVEIMNQASGDVFMYCSTTHLDRIKAFGTAAEQVGRPLVMSFPMGYYTYQAFVQGLYPDLPCPKNRRAKIFYRERDLKKADTGFKTKMYTNFKKHLVTKEDFIDRPVAFIGNEEAIFEWDRMKPESVVIFSMYTGYLKGDGFARGFDERVKQRGSRLDFAHTSGHATQSDLIKAAVDIKPRFLVPVHCKEPERFCCEDIVQAEISVIIQEKGS